MSLPLTDKQYIGPNLTPAEHRIVNDRDGRKNFMRSFGLRDYVEEARSNVRKMARRGDQDHPISKRRRG